MFSEFEKYIFRNRERVQPFRDGKIRLCDGVVGIEFELCNK